MDFLILYALLAVLIILAVIILAVLFSIRKNSSNDREFSLLRSEINQTTMSSVNNLGQAITRNQSEKFDSLERRFQTFSLETDRKIDRLKLYMEQRLDDIQNDNNAQLDKIRQTVDEKLESTLKTKMDESFKRVSDQLEAVYKGLGEMQNLASGVGDLKKVLSNVKTRGILGEIQLGAILEEILAKDQYDTNVITKKGSNDRVEFAIKLPSDDDSFIYLPIDSKFPGDSYANLRDAYELGDKESIEAAWKNLKNVLMREASDISSKYIDVPETTEFAIMFLPFEGLYSEAVNRGMIELMQQKYRINICGPSTMAAFLNSIQMGFKTLAVQKRSAQVWKVLSGVKAEFENFNNVLISTQKRLDQAHDDLDKLIGTRTNKIRSKLKSVELLNEGETDLNDV